MIPGLERSPGEGNGYPLQYSCLENPMGRGVREATVHGVAKSQTCLSDFHFEFPVYCGILFLFLRQYFFLFYILDFLQFCSVTQSYPTVCDPMDCSPPGSSVHGILQARVLEWVAIPFSRDLLPGIEPGSPTLASRFFTI